MPLRELAAYQVQSDSDKKKWHEVVLKPWGRGFKDARCTCMDWRYRRRRCKHIKRAISAYNYGFK